MIIANHMHVVCWSNQPLNQFPAQCDSKFTKIPKRDFIFRLFEDGADWHLTGRISPRSESFLGHVGTGILCEG